MTSEELHELAVLADAHTRQAEARLAAVCQHETQLRQLLEDMADQLEAGMRYAADSPARMRELGAHQAWVDATRRKRASVTSDLALVMANKIECTRALRKQMGQRDAFLSLQQDAEKERRRARAARSHDQIMAGYLFDAKDSELSS